MTDPTKEAIYQMATAWKCTIQKFLDIISTKETWTKDEIATAIEVVHEHTCDETLAKLQEKRK